MESEAKRKIIKNNSVLYGQICIVLSVAVIFLYSATFSKLSVYNNVRRVAFADITVSLLFFVCLFRYLRKKSRNDYPFMNLKKWIKENRVFLILAIGYSFLYLFRCGQVPRWDSEWYFYDLRSACSNYDFTLKSFVENFRLSNHLSWGYAIFLSIGTFWMPDNPFGIQLINLVLYLFALYFVYKILLITFPGLGKKNAVIGCLFVVCEPMALGIATEINLDFGLLVFAIYVWYMHMKNQRILFLFFSILLVNTKETGIIILAGYFIGYLSSRFFCSKGSISKRIHTVVKNPMFVDGVIIAGIFLAEVLVVFCSGSFRLWGTGGNTGASSLSFVFGNQDDILNVFCLFNFHYIWLKIKTIFFMNFNWIMTVILCITIIYCFIKRKRIWKYLPEEYAGFYGAVIVFFIFSVSYVTHNNPRYNLFMVFALFYSGALILLWIFQHYKKFITICFAFLALFLMESYTTVDPLTMLMFDNYSTDDEGTKIVLPAWNNNQYLADTTVYNTQFHYLDKAFDKLLEICEYQGEDIILTGNQRGTYYSGRRFEYEWDREKKTRVCIGNEGTIPIHVIESDFWEKQKQGKLTEKAIYIVIPEYIGESEDYYYELLSKYYVIGEKQTISIFKQGEIYFYEMELKMSE
ncbi:MAG: hypothetical protein SOZ59_07240 [Candidatus Limivivens sp.]|nr:hypothetical protein [Candidatus Limivivens sp.]